MKRLFLMLIPCPFLMLVLSCTKPLVDAHVAKDVHYFSRDFAAEPNDVYYAVRWSLVTSGYPVAKENLSDGIIATSWVPVTSDSHYVDTFGRRNTDVTNSYHQLEIQVARGEGRTSVKVGSRVKTIVAGLKSSGIEEKKLLSHIGDCLRKSEPTLTNLGIDE